MAGTKKCRSQVTSAGLSTGQHATVNKQHLECLLALTRNIFIATPHEAIEEQQYEIQRETSQ